MFTHLSSLSLVVFTCAVYASNILVILSISLTISSFGSFDKISSILSNSLLGSSSIIVLSVIPINTSREEVSVRKHWGIES